MIGRLRGEIIDKYEDRLLVEVGGVGYIVFVPGRLTRLLETGQQCILWISSQVRDGVVTLYGFAHPQEQLVFDCVINVKGIGAKMGLGILSHLSLEELVHAVKHEDILPLVKVPGIGKKTAKQMLLDLNGKLDLPSFPDRPTIPRRAVGDPLPLALAQLGYRKSEIDEALAGLEDLELEDAPLPERISASLKILSGSTT